MRITMTNRYDPITGAMLNERVRQVFGFSFQDWFDKGQWTEQYEVYSIIEDGRMRACVGLYKTDLVIQGKTVRTHQIGAVTTAPDCRMQGCQCAIFEHIFTRYPDVPAFLHANDTVTRFYPRLGFRRVWEGQPMLEARIDNPVEPLKLHLGDSALERALDRRGPLSAVLDAAGTRTVQVFHQLTDYGDANYFLPELGVVVIAKQDGDTLFLADVLSEEPISFELLRGALPFQGVRRVEFGFCPDLLGVQPEWETIRGDDEALFVRGDWALPTSFRMPVTSRT